MTARFASLTRAYYPARGKKLILMGAALPR
jgi:hypothetical protein